MNEKKGKSMVDNRSAGYFGIGGAFNFKSGDISGTAAKLSDDKMGQGGEYFAQQKAEEDENANAQEPRYMDQSAVLRASLNSLAMMNVANIINSNKRKPAISEQEEEIERDLDEMARVQKVSNPFKDNKK